MIRLNKKAKVYFIVLISIIFMTVILPTAWYISYKKETKFTKLIGESQLLLLKTYEKGESVLYYIDRSAELSLREALHKYSNNAGLNDACDSDKDGYYLWNTADGKCWPTNVKSKIADELKDNLKEFFDAYPEKIPEIDYTIEGKENSTIGKTNKKLRIDITEKNIFNFEVMDGFAEEEEEEQTTPVQNNNVPVGGGKPLYSPVPQGRCSVLAEYGKRYIGCAYALNDISGAYSPPEQCDKSFDKNSRGATYTCAGLTSSIVYNIYHIGYSGNGREKCDQGAVHKVSKDPNQLQPGDFFASEVRCYGGKYCHGGYTEWGHTGMYIGRGYVSNNAYGRVTCYLTYQYDPNGEPVFIHSNGGSEHGQPGVCYATYNQLFNQNSIFVLRDFCRLNVCGA
jgi:hypothetical protein